MKRWIPTLLLAAWMSPALALDPGAQLPNTSPVMGTEMISLADTVSDWDQPQSKKAVSTSRRSSVVRTTAAPLTPAVASWSFPATKQANFELNQSFDADDADGDDVDLDDIESDGIPNYDKIMDIFFLTGIIAY